MKKLNLLNLILGAVILVCSVAAVSAQDDPDDDMPDRPPATDRDNRGPLMRELGLTQDQIRKIRMLNQQRRPLMMEAQRRQRLATRELDRAIYADAVDEAAIQLRLKELQLAQAEFVKIKATSELEVRKILTPEQLAKFRDLRQRMMERLNDRNRGNGQGPPDRPRMDRPQNAPNVRPDQKPPGLI